MDKQAGSGSQWLKLADGYRMTFDWHTHTTYSHGKGSIEDNVRAAQERGLKEIAITDHGPGHLTYGLSMKKIREMRAEIDRLKAVYPDVNILLGVEANTMRPAPYLDVKPEDEALFDIMIGGYHFGLLHAGMVSNWFSDNLGLFRSENSGLRVKNTAMILDALYQRKLQVLTHPGDKGPFDMEDIARACADTGTLLEINMKHAHLTVAEIRQAAKYDVKFIIGSDAHVPEAVGSYRGSLARALEAGLDPCRIANIEKI